MIFNSQGINLIFAGGKPKGALGAFSYVLALLLLSCLVSLFAIQIVSLIDPERLVPVSGYGVLGAVPAIVFFYFVGIAIVFFWHDIGSCFTLFTILFLIRVAVAIILAFLFQYDDEIGLHFTAMLGPGGGYPQLVRWLYTIFGANLLVSKIMNAFLGSLLPFFAFDLGLALYHDRKAAWRAFFFTGFLPPLVIYSAVNLKEIATTLLFVLVLWFLVVPRRGTGWRMAGAVISTAVLYWLRGPAWAAIGIIGILAYLSLAGKFSFARFWRLSSLVKIGLAVAFAYFLWPFIFDPIRELLVQQQNWDSYYMGNFAASQATVMQLLDTSNPLSPRNAGVLFFRGLFSPSPVRFLLDYSISTLIDGFFYMPVWYCLFPFALIGLWVGRKQRGIRACGVMVLTVVAGTAGIFVVTETFRHRVTILPLMFVLSAGGFERNSFRERIWILYLWWFGIIVFNALWIVFRI